MQNFKQNKCANLLSMSVLGLLTTAVYAGGDSPAPKNHWNLHGQINANLGFWDEVNGTSTSVSYFGLSPLFVDQYNKLYVKGRYMDWGYRVGLADVHGDVDKLGNVGFDYTYIGYHGWDHRTKGGYTDGFEIRAGYMQRLYGLNGSTPSHDLIFFNNAFYDAVENPYGVRLQGNSGSFTYSATVASTNLTMNGNTEPKNADPFYGGRLVYTGGGNHMLWHLGGSARYGQAFTSVVNSYKYDPAWDIEAAVQWNNFLVWGEYQDATYNRNAGVTGDSKPKVKGWYVSAAWLMDGKRGYNMRRATWKRVRPTSRGGAWEVAGSYYDNTDCIDFDTVPTAWTSADCDSGWMAGVNWYANRVVKLGLNYYNGNKTWRADSKNVWWAQLSAAW